MGNEKSSWGMWAKIIVAIGTAMVTIAQIYDNENQKKHIENKD